MSWLLSNLYDTVGYYTSSFPSVTLTFGNIQVTTTAQLAEGGYAFVYSAKEVGGAGRQFAAKKVLVQDAETRAIAETEARLLTEFSGRPNFVVCHGTLVQNAKSGGAKEHWFLLELCPNGSLIDLLYSKRKGPSGEDEYEPRAALPQELVLSTFASV